jgi:hypothetical protein
MATENPKVSGYVPEQVYQKIVQLKEQWQLKSTSQVLTLILQDYFGIEAHPTLSASGFSHTARLLALEAEVKRLDQQMLAAQEVMAQLNLEYQSINRSPDSTPSDRTESLLFRRGVVRQPKITPLGPHRSGELAERLGVSKSTISLYKQRDDFSEWSQSRDPQGVAWTYQPKTKRFDYCFPTPDETTPDHQPLQCVPEQEYVGHASHSNFASISPVKSSHNPVDRALTAT